MSAAAIITTAAMALLVYAVYLSGSAWVSIAVAIVLLIVAAVVYAVNDHRGQR